MTPRSARSRSRGAGRFALTLLAVLAALAASSCRERGTPDPSIKMAASHEPDQTAAAPAAGAEAAGGGDAGQAQSQPSSGSATGASGGEKVSVPTRLEVPAEVQRAYSGIRLAWKDATTGKSGTFEVPLGASAPIPGSPLQVHADVYLPAFTMSGDAITSSGTGEENPAARIAISENGKDLFAGWIFNRFPDVHPFQHPRYSLKLEGGVKSNAKASK